MTGLLFLVRAEAWDICNTFTSFFLWVFIPVLIFLGTRGVQIAAKKGFRVLAIDKYVPNSFRGIILPYW